MRLSALRASVAFLFVTASSACMSGGAPLEGLAPGGGTGARLMWDLDARPLPEIPLPNDMATRVDPSSPTGLRVNASLQAPTAFERNLRTHMADLDGFGVFSPIWMRFESTDAADPELARLDLEQLTAAHRGDTHFADDMIFLVNVTRSSPDYGKLTILDVGNGNFPLGLQDRDQYFPGDPRANASNLFFDTYDEDLDADGHFDHFEDKNQDGTLNPGEDVDGDGRLDPEEDSDSDGVFDKPNTWGTLLGDASRNHSYDDLITFYELETDTLFIRPIVPLRERTTYAIAVTKRLTNRHGDPVVSPFPSAHHLQQTEPLRPLFEGDLLAAYGIGRDDIAFAWTFTTQSTTAGLHALRAGLYGDGPFRWLNGAYPADVSGLAQLVDAPGRTPTLLRPDDLVRALNVIFENVPLPDFDTSSVQPIFDSYGAVDFLVAGDFVSPDLIESGGGTFDVDWSSGRASHAPNPIRFVLVVPKPEYGPRPAPVALYAHGYTSMKLEGLLFAGLLAKFGIATFVFDAYNHGIPLGPEVEAILQSLLDELGAVGLEPFFRALIKDRTQDLNNDGLVDAAGDFWTSNLFHTRDAVRQTVLDYLQGARILRAFDGVRKFPFDLNGNGVLDDLAGDFDGDGHIDVGGPHTPFVTTGMSMGGIHAAIIGAAEPTVAAAAPISPGGGLMDIALRTDLGGAVIPVMIPVMAPILATRQHPQVANLTQLYWIVDDVLARLDHRRTTFAALEDMRPGDILRIENHVNGEVDEVVVAPDLSAYAHIPADVGDALHISLWRPDGVLDAPEGSRIRPDATLVDEVDHFEYEVLFQGNTYEIDAPLVSIQRGLGLRRGTPSMRRLMSLAQTVLEPADPIVWARHYREPLGNAFDPPREKHLLEVVTAGDMTVPSSAGVALARAAGIVGYEDIDPRYGKSQNQLLIDTHVVEALEERYYYASDCCHSSCENTNFDIDDLSNGTHPSQPPRLTAVVTDLDCGPGDEPAANCGSCEPLPPLRASVARGTGVDALRIPMLQVRGRHVIDVPNPNLDFDPSIFVINQVGLFLASHGRELSDHPCLAKNDCRTCSGDCPSMPPPSTMGVTLTP